MACLSIEQIALYVAGAASTGDAATIAHVESCESCREHVAAAVRAGRRVDPAGESIDDELAIGTPIGRYVITSWLGTGGMGRVYAAYDPQLDRKVALKLLRTSRSSRHAELCARLVREAQATAQLSHPNVVAVYDVGSVGSQVFVAMELVDGDTLRAWLRAKPRDRRAVVDVFRQAGHGIAAAHAAGLIHRDIKPDNMLVGRDGRVRVTDFGLARAVTASIDAGDVPATLTMTGGLVGTPAYMAPEQLLGDPTDARSDQFSFCVALYEGLYGERPFAGDTLESIAASVLDGRIQTPARDSVPGWLRKIVVRGFATDPAARYPTMTDLIAALGHDPRIRNRRIAVGTLAAAAIAGGIFWARREPAASPCQDSAARLGAAWDGDRKRAVAAAFAATHRPFADIAVGHVDAALDRYAAGWITMHRDACEATRVRGDQSEDLLDRRNACLEERRAALAAQTELFAKADGALVDRALRLVHDLPDLAACADTKGLLALVPPPREAARRSELEQLRGRLGSARVLQRSARYADAQRAVGELRREVAALAYPPLTAELDELDAMIGEELHDPKLAVPAFDRAVLAAEAGGDDQTKARALLGAARVRSMFDLDRDQVDRLIAQVRATISRVGGSSTLEIRLESTLGANALVHGKFGDAPPHYRRAVELAEREFGAADVRTAKLAGDLGESLERTGKLDEAKALLTRAIGVLEVELGSGHPEVSRARGQLATLLFDEGKYADALALLVRVRADLERVFGANDGVLWTVVNDTARAHEGLLEFREALALYQHGRELVERAYGPEHPNAVIARLNVASALLELNRFDDAIPTFRDTIALATKVAGANTIYVANAQNGLAQALRKAHPRDALAAAQTALAIFRSLEGDAHVDVGHVLTTIGMLESDLGRRADAVATLTRAAGVLAKALGDTHPDTAATRFELAARIYDAGERAKGRAMAEASRRVFADGGDAINAKEVDDWLAKHPS